MKQLTHTSTPRAPAETAGLVSLITEGHTCPEGPRHQHHFLTMVAWRNGATIKWVTTPKAGSFVTSKVSAPGPCPAFTSASQQLLLLLPCLEGLSLPPTELAPSLPYS